MHPEYIDSIAGSRGPRELLMGNGQSQNDAGVTTAIIRLLRREGSGEASVSYAGGPVPIRDQ